MSKLHLGCATICGVLMAMDRVQDGLIVERGDAANLFKRLFEAGRSGLP